MNFFKKLSQVAQAAYDGISNEVEYTFSNKTDPLGKRPKEALLNTLGQAAQGLANELPGVTEALKITDQVVSPIIQSVTDQAEWEAEQGNISPMATLGHGLRTIRGTGNAGAHVAHNLGVDQDIGRFLGESVAETVLTAGLGKATKALRTLPPLTIGGGPKLALAGAGIGGNSISIKPLTKPSLSSQVMEARAKPGMTQHQWDTQRGAEIRIKRDKVENSNTAMQNIVDNNPGISKKELKTKNVGGYKSELRRYEDGQAQVSSAESNIVVPTTDNPYAFPRGEAGARVYKEEVRIANEALGRSIEQLDLHHLIPKGMSAAIYNRARDFIEEGLVDAKYLNRISEKFRRVTGADTGDLTSGILPMRKPQHDAMHLEMRLQPSDTFPGENMELMKEALTTKLTKIRNPKDFELMLDNLLENDIKPLVENARNWENMDDLIKSESPSFTGLAKPTALKIKKK